MFKIIKYVQNKIKGAKMSRRKKKNKAKKIIKLTLIIAVTFIIIVFLYNTYANIEINRLVCKVLAIRKRKLKILS